MPLVDDALTRAAQRGDQAALDQLLRSSLPVVYHVAARSLPPADADDVVQETLIRAVRGLPGLRRPERFSSWLLSIALRETRRRGAQLSTQRAWLTELDVDRVERAGQVAGESDDRLVERVELSRQRQAFTRAAAWLEPKDRELLDLWWLVQAGAIERADLAPALGVSAAHTRVRLQRMRSRLDTARHIEEAVGAAAGGAGCPSLADLVRDWPRERSALWRKRFARHIDHCPRCRSTAKALVAPEMLLASFPLLVPPAHLGHSALTASTGGGAAAAGPVASPGGAVPGGAGHLRPLAQAVMAKPSLVAAVLGLTVVAGVGLAVAVFHRDEQRPARPVAAAPRTQAAAPASGEPTPTRSRPPRPKRTSPTPAPPPSAPSHSPAPLRPGGVGAGSGGPSWSGTEMPPTQGGRYLYVGPSGDDGADGLSRASAVRTLQRAAGLTRPGDTVLVVGGTYSAPGASSVLGIDTSGTPGHWITYAAYPGTRPLIRASGWQGIHVHASYVTVSGFTVRGNSEELTAAQRARARSGDTHDQALNGNCIAADEQRTAQPPRRPHHVRIWGNTVTRCPLVGISAQFADYVTVAYNIAAHNSRWSPFGGSGISFNSAWNSDGNTTAYKMVIKGNLTYDNENLVPSASGDFARITDGNGIIVDSFDNAGFHGAPLRQASYTGRTLIEDNVSYDNGGRGAVVYRSGRVDLVHNTLYHNVRSAELTSDLTAVHAWDVTVTGNIVAAAPGERAADFSPSGRSRFSGNLLVGDYSAATGRGTNRGGDPLFADPGAGDFHLRPGSAAIDRGVPDEAPEEAPALDADRLPRDGHPDLGAYEHR
ncbi:sigma-70 family RNA polymerase sigma factor [Streptomyces sp. NPDC049954]|uniref:sigma-70 family RNA polymerase sigma factor n=1 Tax=Streptomyces sp. NPDC049954 TaxID=3155779 RepID=UPI003413ADFB